MGGQREIPEDVKPIALFDTDLYIEIFNRKRFVEQYLKVVATSLVRYSAVVLHELSRGAIDPASWRIYAELERTARGRIIIPSEADWKMAGEVLRRILKSRKELKSKLPTLQNDVLIALSAKGIGARVYTLNVRDFAVIQRYLPVQVTGWGG